MFSTNRRDCETNIRKIAIAALLAVVLPMSSAQAFWGGNWMPWGGYPGYGYGGPWGGYPGYGYEGYPGYGGSVEILTESLIMKT